MQVILSHNLAQVEFGNLEVHNLHHSIRFNTEEATLEYLATQVLLKSMVVKSRLTSHINYVFTKVLLRPAVPQSMNKQ